MSAKMPRERAEKFGAAWNSGNADLVTSFFAEDGAYHASVGPDHLGKSYFGKENIRRGVQAFFDRFPDGKFENLKVVVAGDVGPGAGHGQAGPVQDPAHELARSLFDAAHRQPPWSKRDVRRHEARVSATRQ
jgi:ketosteroid isomerase-like protein